MKIAVWYNVPSGGAKRALYDHVRGLVARGHAVEVWCPPTADRDFMPLNPIAREHVVDLQWTTPFRRLDEWQITLQIERSLAALAAHCQECVRQMEKAGFDILFANSCRFVGAAPIARFTSLPSVLYLQEPYRVLYEAQPRLRWLAQPARAGSPWKIATHRAAFADVRRIRNWRVQAREEVISAEAFGRILVNSYFSRESILRSYGLDSDVCYLGIDTEHFEHRNLVREDVIVGLSSFTRNKNLHFCISAIGNIAPPRPKLIWIGNMADQGYFDELCSHARSLNVEFEPHVGASEHFVVDLLNRARAMVYAPRLEPFGLAPLEAAACGLPVIAVAEGGVRETVIDEVTGLLVGHDPILMARAGERLRSDHALAEKLGRNARLMAEEKWGVEAASDRLEAQLLRYAGSR